MTQSDLLLRDLLDCAKKGAVSFRVYVEPRPKSSSVMSPLPYVEVSARGLTWKQAIRAPFNEEPRLEDVYDAFSVAVDKVVR